MGGYISLAATRGCRATHTLIVAALALALLAAVAGTASAQPAASRQLAPGMTTPAGVAVTPDGDVWVSDALYGVGHGHPHGLAMDEFGAPEPIEPPVPPATPTPETRPSGTGEIAFD